MTVRGKWKRVSSLTRGYELDGVLTTLFGEGVNVVLAVNRETKEFIASDDLRDALPTGFEIVSGGQVGEVKQYDEPKPTELPTQKLIQDRVERTTNGGPTQRSNYRNEARPKGLTSVHQGFASFAQETLED